jgi:hypothetical protein
MRLEYNACRSDGRIDHVHHSVNLRRTRSRRWFKQLRTRRIGSPGRRQTNRDRG